MDLALSMMPRWTYSCQSGDQAGDGPGVLKVGQVVWQQLFAFPNAGAVDLGRVRQDAVRVCRGKWAANDNGGSGRD